ncbi:MAG: hydroxymethylbilane synthase [Clostridia bacterium]
MKIRVGSRESRLAVIQSELAMAAIRAFDPSIETELVTMKTTGDRILDQTLDQIGGKGLFVKELDRALLDDVADITVHSLKDMPMETDPRLPIVAFSKREDPRDALVLPAGETELNLQKPFGAASKRRALQLQQLFPGCRVELVRGNVQTRLSKLDSGQYGALVLASAGLRRLGMMDRISRLFSVSEILPSAGQGTLSVQARTDFDASVLQEFHDADNKLVSLGERAFVRALNGGCSSPVAAYAEISNGGITITGLYVNAAQQLYYDQITGDKHEAERLGALLAKRLKEERA